MTLNSLSTPRFGDSINKPRFGGSINQPRFGALQLMNIGGQHHYALYSADNPEYEADGVYYMTARVGTSEAVGKLSRRLAEGGDKYYAMQDFLVLLNRDVLPEGRFEAVHDPEDTSRFMGPDGDWHRPVDEFNYQRPGMAERFRNKFARSEYFYFDKTDHSDEQALMRRKAERQGRMVVEKSADAGGRPLLSVTV